MTVRWGIIGTGDVADRKGGPALYQVDRSELVGVTSRTSTRAEPFASRHGQPRVYPTVEELLADPAMNAVYVATPPDSHAMFTEQAAAAGKHVLCEKPMAASVSECKRMISVCAQNHVSLTIAYYRRYFPVVQKMKSLVESGAVGKPLRISATTFSQFGGKPDAWRLNPSIGGGGFLMDMGTHRFDLFGYFFGRVREVRGLVATQSLDGDVEDAATVAVAFKNGVQGAASCQWNCSVDRDTLEIVGTDGILSTDSLSNHGRLKLETELGIEHWRLPASVPVHLKLVEQLVAHLLDGESNPCTGESGMLATEVVAAAYADSKRQV